LTAFLFPSGRLTFQAQHYRAAFGEAGLRHEKHEGDQCTPIGLLPLRRVLYRADRVARPRAAVPVEPLAPTDGWCDDPAHADYNTMVTLPHPARHEALWRADAVYDVIGVLGWNDQPVVRGRGSAIFLHVARPDYAPTQGCVALALADVLALLAAGCTGIEVGDRQ
jgi:L,D-peptidoglycan transpeptidase YkuD (ErfK/YbiS/YcfS/YnhG family)